MIKIQNFIPDSDASHWYRILWPQQTLAEKGLAQFRTAMSPTLDSTFAPDIAIFQRIVDQKSLDFAIELKKQGIRVVYEIDDDYANLPFHNMANMVCTTNRSYALRHIQAYRMNPLMQEMFPKYKYLLSMPDKDVVDLAIANFGRLIQFMHISDLVQVSTESLRKTYRGYGAKNIIVLPNLEKEGEWHGVIKTPLLSRTVIGWAGSFSHYFVDLKPIAEPVIRVMNENPGVHLHLIGIEEAGEFFKKAPKERVFTEKWSNWEHYKEVISEFDITLAPSFDSKKFANGKSPIRIQQSMMTGTPFVCSPPTYEETARASNGGLIAKTQGQWYEHLTRLVKDGAEARAMGRRGKEWILQKTLEKNVGAWQVAYESLLGG